MSRLRGMVKRSSEAKRLALCAMRLLAPIFSGFHPTAIFRYVGFLSDLRRFRAFGGKFKIRDFYPCLFDRTASTTIDTHYFHQAAWAARRIYENRAAEHTDIGSEVNFVGMLTAFFQVTFIDIRPLELDIADYRGMQNVPERAIGYS